MSEKLALLTFTSSSVKYDRAKRRRRHPTFNADLSVPGFTSNDEGAKLAEELNKKPINFQVNLWLKEREENSGLLFYDLQLLMTSGETSVLQKLRNLFGDEIKFSVYLKPILQADYEQALVSAEQMTVSSQKPTCAIKSIKFNEYFTRFFSWVDKWEMKIKIHVPNNLGITADIWSSNNSPVPTPPTTATILDEEMYSDVIISAGNGAEIKAHKAFLSANSPVLCATFEHKMQESLSGTLDMTDLSEKSVRAFLRYLYSKDLSGPKTDIEVAFELLYAAHKYNVPKLESLMITQLGETDEEYYQVGLAFKIYSFVKLLDNASTLKAKAIRILKFKWDELEATQEFQDLFADNPAGAIELCRDIVKSKIDFLERPDKGKESGPVKWFLKRGLSDVDKDESGKKMKKEDNDNCRAQ